jgi:tetratricopeptide (TPR) repeat protein
VALHWLSGLMALARGEDAAALVAFERELSTEAAGHLYARECASNTWYAIGAVHLRRGATEKARHAFEQAIDRAGTHAMAKVGLALANGTATPPAAGAMPASAEQLLALAAQLVVAGRHGEAAQLIDRGLSFAPPGSIGWLLPVEPLLGIARAPDAWSPVLARLRMRAA